MPRLLYKCIIITTTVFSLCSCHAREAEVMNSDPETASVELIWVDQSGEPVTESSFPQTLNGIDTTYFETPAVLSKTDTPAAIHCLDIGGGYCTILVHGGDLLIVDVGNTDGYEKIVQYIDGLKPQSISIAVTHLDKDHGANLAAITRRYHDILNYISIPVFGDGHGFCAAM